MEFAAIADSDRGGRMANRGAATQGKRLKAGRIPVNCLQDHEILSSGRHLLEEEAFEMLFANELTRLTW